MLDLDYYKNLLPSDLSPRLISVYNKGFFLFLEVDDVTLFDKELLKKLASQLKKNIRLKSGGDLLLTIKSLKDYLQVEKLTKNIVLIDKYNSVVYFKNIIQDLDPELLNRYYQETRWVFDFEKYRYSKSKTLDLILKYYNDSSFLKERDNFLKTFNKNWPESIDSEAKIFLITFGSTNYIGGSCYLIKTKNFNLILESGLKFSNSNSQDTLPKILEEDLDIRDINLVVISHAHSDHCGSIARLYNRGYRGPAIMTYPTLLLSFYQNRDTIKINKLKNFTNIFNHQDIEEWLKRAIIIDYNQKITILRGLSISLFKSSHILGAAMVYIKIAGINILFTGDYSLDRYDTCFNTFFNSKTNHVDYLLTETTYAGIVSKRDTREQMEKVFIETIDSIYRGGNQLLIPCFAINRSQEVILFLSSLFKKNLIAPVPVYIEGNISEINNIFIDSYNYWNSKEVIEQDLFYLDNYFYNTDPTDEVYQQPAIFVATPGMPEFGKSLQRLIKISNNQDNYLFLCGYQAPGTTGDLLSKKYKKLMVNLLGIDLLININFKIINFSGFSSHATARQIKNFIKNVNPSRVFLLHGEGPRQQIFSRELTTSFTLTEDGGRYVLK